MLKKLPSTIAKLGVTTLVIGCVFWGVITLYPSARDGVGVKTSDADILALGFGPPSANQKFSAALERLGHEPPRVYDMNENTVFFSTSVHPYKTPNEVLREYQEEFVRQGINTKTYTTSPARLARMNTPGAQAELKQIQEASMKGEIIPYQVSDQEFSIGSVRMDLSQPDPDSWDFSVQVDGLERNLEAVRGAYEACGGSADILKQKRENPTPSEVTELSKKVDQAAGKVSNCGDTEESCSLTRGRYRAGMTEMEALKAAVDEQPHLRRCPIMKKAAQFGIEASKDDFTERVRGFQSLDAQYDKERNITQVSATWSDTEFDARKTKPNRFGHLNEKSVVSRLPLCETCTRTWDFGGNGNESNYSVGQITAPMTVRSTADYYTRKLTEQGWQVSEAQIAINELYRLSGKPDDGNRWLRVVRGNEHMSVHISPRAGGGSRVTATSAN